MDDSTFGLKSGDLEIIVGVISKFPGIKKAVIFGSRAKGNNQPGSDVDVAIWAVDGNAAWRLPGILNDETLLPYKFDVLNYDELDNPDLKEQIDKIGVQIFQS
jgi:predicted nucleotidyltransferase